MRVTPLRRLFFALLAAVPLATLCLPVRAETGDPTETMTTAEVGRQVRALEAAVQADHARLLLLVSTPRAKSATPLYQEPELKEIAHRLPALQAKLARWADFEPATRPSYPAPTAPDDAATKDTP